MKNSLSIGKKIFLIGTVFVAALCILGVKSCFTNNRVKDATTRAVLRNQQIEHVASIQQYQLALVLDAMDSIVDRGEGKISAERMQSINTNVERIHDKFKELEALADTDTEKKATQRIQANFQTLAKAIRVDLARLIESEAADEEFARIDDAIDGNGNQMEKDLAMIASSVREEQQEATEQLNGMLSSSSIIGLLTFLLSVGVSLPVLYLISRSIVKPIRKLFKG